MWQWALCTGLRTSSLVRIELKAFSALTEHSRWGQTIEVPAKGGKIVGVHVPTELIVATARYVAVDRVLVAGRRDRPPEAALFLNARGQSVTGKSFYRALRRASARSGVSARPHQARTTFATYVRDKLEAMTCAGANLDAVKVVQSLLAHADARTTEQYLESIDVPSLDVLQALDDLARTAVWDQDGP
jgi:integrase